MNTTGESVVSFQSGALSDLPDTAARRTTEDR